MLSRVAESIYWLNRYIERAENYARLIDVNLSLSLDLPPGQVEQWRPLVMTTGDEELFVERYGEYSKENVIHFLTFDTESANSIISCLSKARENARVVRDSISLDMWIQINELYLNTVEMMKTVSRKSEELALFYRHIRFGSHLFEGIMEATLTRSEVWHFGNVGRYLERADKTDRIIDMKYFFLLPTADLVGTPLDLMQWSALLQSASAFQMYRKTCGKLDIARIVQFLVFDRFFPRAVRYCLTEVERSLHAVSGSAKDTFSNAAEKQVGLIQARLSYNDVGDIFRAGLHEYLDDLQGQLNDLGNSITETFFLAPPDNHDQDQESEETHDLLPGYES